MRKRAISLALALSLVFSASVGLTSCEQAASSEEITINQKPADTYDMAEEEGLGSKILQFALDTSYAGAATIVSDLALWGLEGIAEKMGFNFSQDKAYQKQVLERLSKIESSIQGLQNSLDWLTEQFEDSKYLNSYNDFMKEYNSLNTVVYDQWGYYVELEEMIANASKSENINKEKIEKALDNLCANIRNGEVGTSKLDDLIDTYSTAFINNKTSTPTLDKHSIIYIVERFVNKSTPYKDRRHVNYDEIMCSPYTVFYQGTNLCLIEYSRVLNKGGVISYELSKGNNLVAYTVVEDDVEKTYLNCPEYNKDNYLKAHKDEFTDYSKYKALPAKALKEFNIDLMHFDSRIEKVVKRYNSINKIFNDFLDDRYAGCDANKKYLVYDDGQTQVSNRFIRTVTAKDFLRVDGIGEDGNMYLKYDSFGNITSDEFIKFANAIRKAATYTKENGQPGYYTWRKFFTLNGYSFPTNNNAKMLMLGAYWHGFNNYSDWANNGVKFCNSFFLYMIDLDTTIESFCTNHNYTIWTYSFYAFKETKEGACGAPTHYAEWRLLESRDHSMGGGQGLLYDCAHGRNNDSDWSTTVYTIDGLSVNPRKGEVNTKEHSVTF